MGSKLRLLSKDASKCSPGIKQEKQLERLQIKNQKEQQHHQYSKQQQNSQRSDQDTNIALRYLMGRTESNPRSSSYEKFKQDKEEISQNQFNVAFQINKFQEHVSQINSQKVMEKALESPKQDPFEKKENMAQEKEMFAMNLNALLSNYSYLNDNFSSLLCFIESLLEPLINLKLTPETNINFKEIKQKFQLFKSIQSQIQQNTVDVEFIQQYLNKTNNVGNGSPSSQQFQSSFPKSSKIQKENIEFPQVNNFSPQNQTKNESPNFENIANIVEPIQMEQPKYSERTKQSDRIEKKDELDNFVNNQMEENQTNEKPIEQNQQSIEQSNEIYDDEKQLTQNEKKTSKQEAVEFKGLKSFVSLKQKSNQFKGSSRPNSKRKK